MRYTSLAGGELEVSVLGLGCMGMSEFYGPADDAESLKTLNLAADLGVTFLDTSDFYGMGHNERLLARLLSGRDRADLIVATKFGGLRDPETGATVGLRGDAPYVRQACEASLKRLGVDHIDLYYVHFPDPQVPIEETIGAMAELAAVGKVRYIGLSNVTVGQLRVAHQVHPIAAVQNEWSLFTRGAEESVVPACAELKIGFVPYAPLGRGFLTGVYTSTTGLAADDFRHAVPRFSAENSGRNAGLLEPVRRIAQAHGATVTQVALAWLLRQQEAHGLAVAPIPGTRRESRLRENLGAADLHLTVDDLAALEPIAGQVAGSGSPPLPPDLARKLGLAQSLAKSRPRPLTLSRQI